MGYTGHWGSRFDIDGIYRTLGKYSRYDIDGIYRTLGK